jgi:hypothetical protein
VAPATAIAKTCRILRTIASTIREVTPDGARLSPRGARTAVLTDFFGWHPACSLARMRQSLRLLPFACALVFVSACAKSDYVMTDGGRGSAAIKGKTYSVTFDNVPDELGSPAFEAILGEWKVRADASAQSAPEVYWQLGDFHMNDFPRAVMRDVAFTNARVKTRCRPQSGEHDQACGVMFRFQNSDNYMLVRANALEGNVNLYTVIDGDRDEVTGADADVASGAWHTLEVVTEGDRIRVHWDQKQVIDERNGTFTSGKVGLWTKADSVTAFDDFEATEL